MDRTEAMELIEAVRAGQAEDAAGGVITNARCREVLGLGDNHKRATYLLARLKRRGLIRQQRKGRWSRYVLV